MLSREELIKRGARFKDGTPVVDKTPEPEASPPLVAAPTIDTKPLAEAISQLSEVVKTTLESQRPILDKIAEQQVNEPKPEQWEFRIERDARGRIETITAKALAA